MRLFFYIFCTFFFIACSFVGNEVENRFYSSKIKNGEIIVWVNESSVSNEKDNLEFEANINGVKFDSIEIVLSNKCCILKYVSKVEDSFFFEVDNIDNLYNKNKTIDVILRSDNKNVAVFKLLRKKRKRNRDFISH